MDPILEEFINQAAKIINNETLFSQGMQYTPTDSEIAAFRNVQQEFLRRATAAASNAASPEEASLRASTLRTIQNMSSITDYFKFVTDSIFKNAATNAGVNAAQIELAFAESSVGNVPVMVTKTGQQIVNSLPSASKQVIDPIVSSWARAQGGSVTEVTRNLPQLTSSAVANNPQIQRVLQDVPSEAAAATAATSFFASRRGQAIGIAGVIAALTAVGAYLASGGTASKGTGWNADLPSNQGLAPNTATPTPTPTSAEIQLAQETGASIGGPPSVSTNQSAPTSSESPIIGNIISLYDWITSSKKPAGTASPAPAPAAASPAAPSEDAIRLKAFYEQMVDPDPAKALEGARAFAVNNLSTLTEEDIALENKKASILSKPASSRTPEEVRFISGQTNDFSSYAYQKTIISNRLKVAADDVTKATVDIANWQKSQQNQTSPELAQAQVDLVKAQTASANASASHNAASSALVQAQAAREAALTPLQIKAAEQNIKNAELQFQVTTNEIEKSKLALLDAELQHRRVTVIDTLAEDAKNGKITTDQYITAVATLNGDTATLSNRLIEADRAKRETRRLDLEEANANRDFALRQTTAVAQNAMEQARLDLQRTAEARAAAQARAQNMQALTAAQTQRQAAYNQAATEYERFGVATPTRIQGLQDLKAPLPAAQAAGMLGLDVNSPEFKAVYDTYSMALAPGQGTQQPTQPAPAAPAPVPNPVTNSIPLISMPTMGNTPYLTQALGGLKTGYSPV